MDLESLNTVSVASIDIDEAARSLLVNSHKAHIEQFAKFAGHVSRRQLAPRWAGEGCAICNDELGYTVRLPEDAIAVPFVKPNTIMTCLKLDDEPCDEDDECASSVCRDHVCVPATRACNNFCALANDGVCNDFSLPEWGWDGEAVGADGAVCMPGADCSDCGNRGDMWPDAMDASTYGPSYGSDGQHHTLWGRPDDPIWWAWDAHNTERPITNTEMCFADGYQNNGETGIDCGDPDGLCPPCV